MRYYLKKYRLLLGYAMLWLIVLIVWYFLLHDTKTVTIYPDVTASIVDTVPPDKGLKRDYNLRMIEDWYYLYDGNRLVDSFSANQDQFLDSIIMRYNN